MQAILEVLANEATAAQRRVYFQLWSNAVNPGMEPAPGEAGGQPQVSTDGASFTNTGIGTLTYIGNGRYYADLTQALVDTAGRSIQTRYKSDATYEAEGWSVRTVGFDPNSSSMGMLRLKKNVAGQRVFFYIRDANSPQMGLTSQTPTVTRSLNGAAFSAATGTVSEIGSGWYCLLTSAADTNADDIIYKAVVSGGIDSGAVAYPHA